MNTIECTYLNKSSPALKKAPFPDELGKRILQEISKPAWMLWLNQQTMLINEYRLDLSDQKAQVFLKKELVKFLFEKDSTPPQGYQKMVD